MPLPSGASLDCHRRLGILLVLASVTFRGEPQKMRIQIWGGAFLLLPTIPSIGLRNVRRFHRRVSDRSTQLTSTCPRMSMKPTRIAAAHYGLLLKKQSLFVDIWIIGWHGASASCRLVLMSELTRMLQAAQVGDRRAAAELLLLVYEELRTLAASKMAAEAPGHTLNATALVHEAYLRLVGDQEFDGRGHFFAAAAEAMRRILIERARRKSRLKHGGGLERVDIEGMDVAATTADEKILLIDEALGQLEAEHPERAQVVVLKYFGGLTNKEVAESLGIGERTVDRHWLCAKNWLFRKIRTQF